MSRIFTWMRVRLRNFNSHEHWQKGMNYHQILPSSHYRRISSSFKGNFVAAFCVSPSFSMNCNLKSFMQMVLILERIIYSFSIQRYMKAHVNMQGPLPQN
ncbi:hypothetical protein SUGI_0588540 [Cryptomeria japonica]|nr:hypothetical protein SUGI_0588540 [Cryptomeria japonica]